MDPDPDTPFIKLLTDHQTAIRAFVISLLPGTPGHDDVIQETNVLIWEKRSAFTLGTNFQAWAFAIARYQVMGHLRMLKRQGFVTLDGDVAEMLADEMEGPDNDGFVAKRIEALKTCMRRIRPEDRELLLERYWRNTRLQDFAASRRRSLNGMRVQLFRLRAALKSCIEERIGKESCP